MTTLARELLEHLFAEAENAAPGDHWVMSAGWMNDVRRLEGHCGEALAIPSPRFDGPWFLLGRPVEAREDGGAPHLVAA